MHIQKKKHKKNIHTHTRKPTKYKSNLGSLGAQGNIPSKQCLDNNFGVKKDHEYKILEVSYANL